MQVVRSVWYRRCPRAGSAVLDEVTETCGYWTTAQSIGWFGKALTVERFEESPGQEAIYLAARRPNNDLHIFRATNDSSGNLSVTRDKIFNIQIVGTPDIHAKSGVLYVTWRDAADQLWTSRKAQGGVWTNPERISDCLFGDWTSSIDPTMALNRSNGSLYMVTARSDGQLRMLRHNSGRCWFGAIDAVIPESDKHRSDWKAGLVWKPFDRSGDPEGDGYFIVSWPVRNTTGGISPFMEALYVGDSLEQPRLGKFGNEWFSPILGGTVDFIHDVDQVSTVAVIARPYNGAAQLNVLPYADGIFPRVMHDVNDFEVMSEGICQSWAASDGVPCGRL